MLRSCDSEASAILIDEARDTLIDRVSLLVIISQFKILSMSSSPNLKPPSMPLSITQAI